jgi:flagellin-like hook-associated protein FlgL
MGLAIAADDDETNRVNVGYAPESGAGTFPQATINWFGDLSQFIGKHMVLVLDNAYANFTIDFTGKNHLSIVHYTAELSTETVQQAIDYLDGAIYDESVNREAADEDIRAHVTAVDKRTEMITSAGDGLNYLSDDGTYKPVQAEQLIVQDPLELNALDVLSLKLTDAFTVDGTLDLDQTRLANRLADGSTITANAGVLSAVNVAPSPDVDATVFGKSGDLSLNQYVDDQGIKHVVYGADIPGTITITAIAALECAAEIAAFDAAVVEPQFDAVEAEIGGLTADLTATQADVGVIQGDVATLQTQVGELQADMTEAQGDILDLGDTNVQVGAADEDHETLTIYAPDSELNPLLT